MKLIFRLLPLLSLAATSLAVEVPTSLAQTAEHAVSYQSGVEGEAPAAGKLPRIRVDAANKAFVNAAGQRFTPCGLSYYRPGTGWAPQLWKQFDAEATRRDFQQMKRLGLNVARVFITYGSFYTQPGQLDPVGLATFDRMLDLADEAGIYLHPTGPEAWEGLPAWTYEQGGTHSNFASEASMKAKEDFWRLFAGRYCSRSTIWAYDLRNEPTVPWETKEQTQKWDQWRTARSQPIVPVPAKDSPPSEILAVLESMVRECAKPGKPVVIGEFGWYGGGALDPGGKPADEGQQARWGRRVVEVTAPMACGWINWGFYDTPEAKDVSRLTGLLTIEGKDKEWGKVFGSLVQSLPPVKTLPVRPDLPWESATIDSEAMARFQAEYLAAFLARKQL